MKTQLLQTIILITLPVMALEAGLLERQHGAHVHGQASGTLAIDADRLSLSLVVPGMNLVGFEHAPNDEVQHERLQAVRQALESGAWLAIDPGGDCRRARVELATPGFGEARDRRHARDHHDHDHGQHHHDRKHRHEDHGEHAGDDHRHDPDHEHAEFRLEVRVECNRPQDLAWIDLGLFDDYPANEEMRIDVITETRAERVRLSASDSRIRLH